VETNDRGDIGTTADDLCIRTEYVKNTSSAHRTIRANHPPVPDDPAGITSRRSHD
jgi:hypothetical protein